MTSVETAIVTTALPAIGAGLIAGRHLAGAAPEGHGLQQPRLWRRLLRYPRVQLPRGPPRRRASDDRLLGRLFRRPHLRQPADRLAVRPTGACRPGRPSCSSRFSSSPSSCSRPWRSGRSISSSRWRFPRPHVHRQDPDGQYPGRRADGVRGLLPHVAAGHLPSIGVALRPVHHAELAAVGGCQLLRVDAHAPFQLQASGNPDHRGADPRLRHAALLRHELPDRHVPRGGGRHRSRFRYHRLLNNGGRAGRCSAGAGRRGHVHDDFGARARPRLADS